MEVIINNIRHNWKSNFLVEVNEPNQKKWSKKRADYFCTDVIGGTKCFIKRSENGFDGTSIFKELVGKNADGIPKTYGIGEAVENSRKVIYLVTEFIEGDTLDVFLNSGEKVNSKTFSMNLINSVNYIHSLGYWHSDINGDNVFVSKSGKVYLIDIDSCVENEVSPVHDPNKEGGLTTLSNQIGSYALKYYKKHLSKPSTFDYSSIPGVNLNYLQVIFLTYQLKYFQDQKASSPSLFWKKSTFKGLNVEDEIRKVNPQYSDSLFKAALLKPLHKEVVNNLTKEIIASSIKTAPDTNKLKKMKELKDLKVKYAQLEQLVSTHTIERNKLLDDIKDLKKNKQKSPAGWTWFWRVAASIATVIGFFAYTDVSKEMNRYQKSFWNEQNKNRELESNLADLQSKNNELETTLDEIETYANPITIKSVTFSNSSGKDGSYLSKNSTGYISPKFEIYSLKDQNVKLYFDYYKPSGTKMNRNKNEDTETRYLTKGLNNISLTGSKPSSGWVSGTYKYEIYLNGNYYSNKTLTLY